MTVMMTTLRNQFVEEKRGRVEDTQFPSLVSVKPSPTEWPRRAFATTADHAKRHNTFKCGALEVVTAMHRSAQAGINCGTVLV